RAAGSRRRRRPPRRYAHASRVVEMAAGEPLIGLGVSGGIGAYKAVEVARLLQKRGYRVQAILTRNARKFVGPLTFEAITRRPVITSQFATGLNADIE